MFLSKVNQHAETIIHVMIWLAYLFITEFSLGAYWNPFETHYLRLFFLTLPTVFYINALWLIPYYLRKKQWIGYALRVLLLKIVVEIVRSIVISAFEFEHFGKGFIETFSLNPFVDRSLSSYSSLGLLLSFGYKFTKDWIQNIGLIDRLKAEKLEMELAFLRSQVDPHFLFNSLNSMYALALEEGSEKTADAIIKLSTLMRYNLHDSQAKQISLSKEIDYIEKYIALQQLRTTSRTQINFESDINEKDSVNLQIAPMLLIAFIENAFKYSAHPSAPVQIKIHLNMKNEFFVLIVDNSISQLNRKAEASGIGIENVEHRLNLLYPGSHSLVVESQDSNFHIELKIKLHL